MNIRNMKLDDYSQVYRLWMDTPGVSLNNIDDTEEGIARYLARNPGSCFVAEEAGAVVGVILSGHDGRRGLIHHMAVRREERGKGIGKALLARATDALRAEGICKVALVAFGENQAGNAFWEKAGFAARQDLVYRNRELIPIEVLSR